MEFKRLKKLIAIIKVEMQRQLTYKSDFLFFRLSNVVEIVVLIVVWTVVFKTNDVVSGYTYKEMMTYVTIGWLMMFLTSNYGLEFGISRDIYDGKLSSFLLKPIDYIKFLIVYSIGRTSIAFFSGVATSVVIIVIMFDNLIILKSAMSFIIIVGMLIVGYFINLFISIMIGMLAFWTTFVNGPRYSIRVLTNFLSGRMIPLNMLPIFFYKTILFFPFVYIYFIPIQLYLGKITIIQGFKALGVEIIWLALLYWFVRLLWSKGLKRYEGTGI